MRIYVKPQIESFSKAELSELIDVGACSATNPFSCGCHAGSTNTSQGSSCSCHAGTNHVN